MPPVGFKPIISAGERPQTDALDHAATGTGKSIFAKGKILLQSTNLKYLMKIIIKYRHNKRFLKCLSCLCSRGWCGRNKWIANCLQGLQCLLLVSPRTVVGCFSVCVCVCVSEWVNEWVQCTPTVCSVSGRQMALPYCKAFEWNSDIQLLLPFYRFFCKSRNFSSLA